MKLRLANKILARAINTGCVPRGSTLRRSVSAFPCGKREHPRKYWASGMVAAFCRMGCSIHTQRLMIEGIEFERCIEEIGK